jgi:hypothetical protein
MMMKDGCTHASKTPSKNLTTIRDLKSLAAAEQAITTPQHLDVVSPTNPAMCRFPPGGYPYPTLNARYFATGSFCKRRLVGYSPKRTPIYNIVPSQLYCWPTRCASALIPIMEANPRVPKVFIVKTGNR